MNRPRARHTTEPTSRRIGFLALALADVFFFVPDADLDCAIILSSEKRGDERKRADAPHIIGKLAELAILQQTLQKDDAEIAHNGRNDHAHKIGREVGPFHPRLERLDKRKKVGAKYRGNTHEQRVLHRIRTGVPGGDAGGDRAAGTGNAGDGGDRLGTADQERITDTHCALVTAARNDPVGSIEQAPVEKEGRADEARFIIKLLERILERENDEQRQRAEKEHQQKPRAGVFRSLLRECFVRRANQTDSIGHDVDDILPINDDNSQQCSKMQKDIEKHMPLLRCLQIENVLEHRKMAGAGDRQKFCHALNKPQKRRIEDRHEVIPSFSIDSPRNGNGR